jgi:hypothetical protein
MSSSLAAEAHFSEALEVGGCTACLPRPGPHRAPLRAPPLARADLALSDHSPPARRRRSSRRAPQRIAWLSSGAGVPTVVSLAHTLACALSRVHAVSATAGLGLDSTSRIARAAAACALKELAQARGAPALEAVRALTAAHVAALARSALDKAERADAARATALAADEVLATLRRQRRPLREEVLAAWVLGRRAPAGAADVLALVSAHFR